MKTMKILALAALTIVAAACTKEILNDNHTDEPNLVNVTFTAKGESSDETKALFSDYPKIAWVASDAISLLGTKTGNQMFTTGENGHQVTFSGKADLSDEYFYAVYPYDLAVTLNQDGTLANVTVPDVQTATAGNFDPSAYIAIAKSTDKESLEFKAIGGFIKFNFQNFDSAVKSVTLVSNDGKIMAGTANSTYVNDNGSTSHSDIPSAKASTSVKLQGEFDLSKAYFMIVRPAPYETGVTVYVELEDGRVLSRKGTKALFESGKSRNYIRGMILNANYFSEVTDLLTLYNMGYDVNVAGKVINKSTHGDAVLISEDTELTTVSKTVYFVAPEVTLTYNVGTNVSNLVILGADASVRSKMITKGQFKLATSNAENFILSGLDITGGANNFFTVNENGTYPYVAFDNCKIDMGVNKKPIYFMNNASRAIGNFIMNQCDFVTSGDSQNIIQLGDNSTLEYSIITFTNNIFYSTSENGNSAFSLIANGTNTPISTLIIEQNTFANVYPLKYNSTKSAYEAMPYVNVKSISNYTLKNNLFYLNKYHSAYGGSQITYVVQCTPTSSNADNNLLFKDVNNQRLQIYKGGSYTSYTATASNAVTSVDLANGVIVPATTAGATR